MIILINTITPESLHAFMETYQGISDEDKAAKSKEVQKEMTKINMIFEQCPSMDKTIEGMVRDNISMTLMHPTIGAVSTRALFNVVFYMAICFAQAQIEVEELQKL